MTNPWAYKMEVPWGWTWRHHRRTAWPASLESKCTSSAPSAMTSHCGTDSNALERRVPPLMCTYCAEVPIVRPFAECYTNSDYREVRILTFEAAFKVHLFYLVKWCSGFPAITGVFSTLVISGFWLSIFSVSSDRRNINCKLLMAVCWSVSNCKVGNSLFLALRFGQPFS